MATTFTNEALASSGDVAGAQQAAKDDGALNQDPGQPATILTLDGRIVPAGTPTALPEAANTTVVNGQTIPAAEESGTDDALRSITQTQATPPYNPNLSAPIGALGSGTFGILNQNGSQAGPNSGVGQFFAAGQLPGAGSGSGINNLARQSDDNPGARNVPSGTQQVLTQTFAGQIVTQQNQLDQYASYTYALSWYLLTPEQYTIFQTGQKNSSLWMLLMQSGGAAPTPTQYFENNGQVSASMGGRSQFFPYDYYMDDLEITTLIPLGGTGLCHSATDIKFKIVEPNGITLINNLYNAVTTLYKQPQTTSTATTINTNATTSVQNPNYPMAHYCMVIHFYGYDQQGNLIAPATGSYNPTGVRATTDPKAVIEKYYPFIITNLKYRIANKQIEYELTGKPQAHNYNIGTDRGSIPFNFNLAGTTVGQLLSGTGISTRTNTSDPGARTPSTTPPAAGAGRGFVNPPLTGFDTNFYVDPGG
jgi:hypothetical protein